MVGDPEQIRALASAVRAEAERVRRLADRAGATRDVSWRSVAADAFRGQVTGRVHSLRRTAEGMEEAARALDDHAAAVAAAVEELTRVAHLGERLARGALRDVADAEQLARDAARRAARETARRVGLS